MANYGIPYMGSKDTIAHKIAPLFPAAENFYDLFGGGFAMTHYLMLHHKNKYKNFYFNEPAPGVVGLIQSAIKGKFNYKVFKPPFVSLEEFFQKKDHCAYKRIVWSFGNNQRDYLFGKDIEAYKKSLHNAVVFGVFNAIAVKALGISCFPKHLSIRGRRLFTINRVKARIGEKEQLERLERLERLQQLEQLQLTSLDYREVKIKPNSVIYCDPPYKGTEGYLSKFDHDSFWQWVRENQNPVFVSEYAAPKDIPVIMAIRKKARLAHKSPTHSVEKIFGNTLCKKAEFNK